MIFKGLNTLDDLPHELANTIANIYYSLAANLAAMSRPGFFPVEHIQKYGHQKGLEMFAREMADLDANVETLPDRIAEIRKLRNAGRDDLANYAIELELDLLKYGIENVSRKTGIRRALERKIKNPRPEISGLWASMRRVLNER